MKVLMCTPVFYPSVGGLETINLLLAKELTSQGLEVTVVTPTSSEQTDSFPFTVVRRPNARQLMNLYRWCDVFVHNAIVLKYVFPAFTFRKPFIIVHHSCTFNWDQSKNFQYFAKRAICHLAKNIVVSKAVAENLGLSSGYTVINNFYDSSIFVNNNHCRRDGFVYVGRLSREKGVKLLIEAYKRYLEDAGTMTLTIVGDGAERRKLESLVESFGIQNMVSFTGVLNPVQLRSLLNECRTLVLPSICKEAFGIVILEAMACGCYCIGSDGDGIQEAMGGFGKMFRKNDIDSLVCAMKSSEEWNDSEYERYCSQVKVYLNSFSVHSILEKWISFFRSTINKQD